MRYAYEHRDVCIETGGERKREILQLFIRSRGDKYWTACRLSCVEAQKVPSAQIE